MLNDNNQKSILDQIFGEMFIILENNNEFSERIINRLKDTIEKNLFKNQKEIVDSLKE